LSDVDLGLRRGAHGANADANQGGGQYQENMKNRTGCPGETGAGDRVKRQRFGCGTVVHVATSFRSLILNIIIDSNSIPYYFQFVNTFLMEILKKLCEYPGRKGKRAVKIMNLSIFIKLKKYPKYFAKTP
jgi:hypothetical protein